MATDIGSGEEITMDSGDVIEAVRASISVPGIFTPVRRSNQILVDGGLVNPVPVSTARSMGAKYLAAVERINLGLQSMDNPALKQIQAWLSEESLPNIFEVLLSSINVMEAQITRNRLHIDPPDLLIQPHLGNIRFLEFNRAEEIINIGYEETCKQLERESDKLIR